MTIRTRNILITSNTFYKLDFENIRGGLETVVIKTFLLMAKMQEKTGIKPFLATNADSVIPAEFEDQVYRYNFNCVEQRKIDEPERKRFIVQMDDLEYEFLAKWVMEKDISAIYDHNTKPGMTKRFASLGLPMVHYVHNLIYGFEFHTYKAMKEIKDVYPNMICAAPSAYVMNSVNLSIEGYVDFVLPPYLYDTIPLDEVSDESNGVDVFVSRIQRDYRCSEVVKLYGENNLRLDIIGNYHTIDDPYFQVFKDLVAQYPTVNYLGPLDHSVLMAKLPEYRAYVAFANKDAFAMAIYEAQTRGLPVISIHDGPIGYDEYVLWDDDLNNDIDLCTGTRYSAKVMKNLEDFIIPHRRASQIDRYQVVSEMWSNHSPEDYLEILSNKLSEISNGRHHQVL